MAGFTDEGSVVPVLEMVSQEERAQGRECVLHLLLNCFYVFFCLLVYYFTLIVFNTFFDFLTCRV